MSMNEMLKDYASIQKEEEELKKRKEELKAKIIDSMRREGITKYTSDTQTASVVTKETFKYTDEASILKYLTENGFSNYIEMKVRATDLNKQLKLDNVLTENLNKYYTKTLVDTLTVKNN